jgi:hypothetical protein
MMAMMLLIRSQILDLVLQARQLVQVQHGMMVLVIQNMFRRQEPCRCQ